MKSKKFIYFLLVFFIYLAPNSYAQKNTSIFPLTISADKRHFVDNKGRPFLYHADTAWMLFLKLTQPEVREYLLDRKAKKFNTVQVILTGFVNDKNEAPVNRAGEGPFLKELDFSQPNPAYFKHVEWVIQQADSLGLAISIAPLWAGCCREGWAGEGKAMAKNGLQGNFAFGEYLGKRFNKYQNILWIMGGDNDPHRDKENYRQLALGIKQAAPHQLITYHAASTHSSTDVWEQETWVDFSMVYTYFRGFNKAWNKNQPDVYEVAWKEYGKTPVKPFILGESTYEGEHEAWGSALQVRKQAYWALLGGGTGHAYGSPLWRSDPDWRKYLPLPGATSLQHFYTLFTSLPWEKLRPDSTNQVAVAGSGKLATNNYTTTAVAQDGSFCITYLPTPRTITIDLKQLKSKSLTAVWYHPETGKKLKAPKLLPHKVIKFTPPSGNHDWVLVILDVSLKQSFGLL